MQTSEASLTDGVPQTRQVTSIGWHAEPLGRNVEPSHGNTPQKYELVRIIAQQVMASGLFTALLIRS